ncbi:abscission/NoCut checkpoint regulator [Ambystoma mexicanum]|uniref:abscission/NoCut checkpoint regulator n=1 Tax=Ambystoma mexicanum TaxID=8296 RepID=UPI0037E8369C
MDRRCYGCASKFTLFKKECGCKNCGRSFCSGCLGFIAVVPRCGNTQQKVCKQCHGELTSGTSPQSNMAKWSPPANYKKRVAALEAKQNQVSGPLPGQASSHRALDARYLGLSKEDRAIAERLERLKGEAKSKPVVSDAEIESRLAALRNDPVKPIPSTEEMEDRLATLQGLVPPSKLPKPAYQPPDCRTQAQKAADLLTQLTEEVAIDRELQPPNQLDGVTAHGMNNLSLVGGNEGWSSFTADLDPKQLQEEKERLLAEAAAELKNENTRDEKILQIGKRLAILRGQNPDEVTLETYQIPESDEEMEEEHIQRILKQLTEESALDEASGFNIPANQTSASGAPKQNQPRKSKGKAPVMPSTFVAKRPVELASATDRDEELPWCCICNENATIRCHGCEDDLYCYRCFREGHDKYDRKEHKTSNYQPPRKR